MNKHEHVKHPKRSSFASGTGLP